MEKLGILAVFLVIVYLARDFLSDLFFGIIAGPPKLGEPLESALREGFAKVDAARKLRASWPDDLVQAVQDQSDPVEMDLITQARLSELDRYRYAKQALQNAWYRDRLPPAWAPPIIRARRREFERTMRAAI